MSQHRLTFTGTGNALRFRSYYGLERLFNNNLLIETKDEHGHERKLMVDCGRNLPEALEALSQKRQKVGGEVLDFMSITDIFITHLHADHVGSLEDKAFMDMFVSGFIYGQRRRTKLYGKLLFLRELWDRCLAGGLTSIEGTRNSLDTYFDVKELRNKDGLEPEFTIGKLTFQLVATDHVRVDSPQDYPSWGVIVRDEKDRSFFFTGDTKARLDLYAPVFESVDLIFHDCELADFPGSVHAQFHELAQYPEEYRRKMYLVHYSPYYTKPDWKQAVEDNGFLGFWEQQHTVDFDHLFNTVGK